MSIFYIPKEEIDSIRPLLSKIAEQRVGAEGVCTLAELDPDKKFAGCIQFCIEETGIEGTEEENKKELRGRLLYLYVNPERRRQGVAEQLLLAMEESLSKRKIETTHALLPQELSELGEYLENYGFSMKLSDSCCFVRLSSIRTAGHDTEKYFPHISSLQDLPGSTARKIYSEYQDVSVWTTEGLVPDLSCALTESEQDAMLMTREEGGHLAISFAAPAGEAGSDIKVALISWLTERMKESYPATSMLMLCDTRDMTWYNLHVGNPKNGTEAIEGVLFTEAPERMPEGAADEDEEELTDVDSLIKAVGEKMEVRDLE